MPMLSFRTQRRSLVQLASWPLIAVVAILAAAASPASAASIYRGCDAAQWGTSPCWNPANPADVAAMHPCPSWTNRHTRAFDPDEGSYQGFVKIRSTVSCKLAYKLINGRTGEEQPSIRQQAGTGGPATATSAALGTEVPRR